MNSKSGCGEERPTDLTRKEKNRTYVIDFKPDDRVFLDFSKNLLIC